MCDSLEISCYEIWIHNFNILLFFGIEESKTSYELFLTVFILFSYIYIYISGKVQFSGSIINLFRVWWPLSEGDNTFVVRIWCRHPYFVFGWKRKIFFSRRYVYILIFKCSYFYFILKNPSPIIQIAVCLFF